MTGRQLAVRFSGPRVSLIWAGTLFGLGYCLIVILLLAEESLREHLTHLSLYEVSMCVGFILLSTSFGIYAFTEMRRKRVADTRELAAERRLEVLFDSAAEFIFLIDPEGTILRANQCVFSKTGYSRFELLGHHIKSFFTEESQQTCDCQFPELRNSGHTLSDIDFRCRDGSVINMECSATAVPDENGDFTTFLIIQRDVTERLRIARKLKESERRFRAIFNSTYQFIGLLDPEGTILEANRSALDFIGASNADVVGRPFWETPWWSHSPTLQARLQEGVREAAAGKLVRFEARHVGVKGQEIVIDFSLKPVFSDEGETVLIIPEGRDISERIRAEEEAQRTQQEFAHVMRLSTMGEMAAGMAHELNQPLTAMVSYSAAALQLARDIPSLPDAYLDILERTAEQAHRAGDVIKHLREFVSKGSSEKSLLEIDEVVQGIIDFIGWELRDSDIRIVFQSGLPGCQVLIDKVQIEQVLINLIRNAIESIRSTDISDGQVTISTSRSGEGFVLLSVVDNGPGIAPEIANKLFEPYQSSKDDGMGMGLSISRSIVEAHNGKLWTEPQQQGAMFCVHLPGSGQSQ